MKNSVLSLSVISLFLFVSTPFLLFTQASDSLESIIHTYNSFLENEREKNRDVWPSFDEADTEIKSDLYQTFIEKLEALPYDSLTKDDQINFDLLLHVFKNDNFLLQSESHQFPLNSEGGFITGIIYSVEQQNVSDEERRQNFMAKLKKLPAYIDHRIDLMREGMKSGKMSPKIIVEKCVELLEQNMAGKIEDSFFMRPADSQEEEFREQLQELVVSQLIPSLELLHSFLTEEYLKAAPSEVGISSIPGGKEYYEQRVQYFTTLELSPEEVFAIGMDEVERIREEMMEILAQVSWEQDFGAFLDYLRTDPQFYATTPEELLRRASWIAKKIEAKLPSLFGKLPRMPFTVSPVPEAIAPNYTSGRYSRGSYRDQRAGAYWVNTHGLESRPLYALPALTLHEAVPGHHLQITLSQEMEDVPSFRQNTYLSAFGEGWGLYAEYLGIEAGTYETAYEHFGRLTYEMWRACRLVVDPGMHYKGWTREEAFEFMKSNTALSIHEVNTEIDRYIGWPGQAVSYKIGELKIKELRKRAENTLGEAFDIREFHDKILENGSVPLFTLERIIDNYIRDKKQ